MLGFQRFGRGCIQVYRFVIFFCAPGQYLLAARKSRHTEGGGAGSCSYRYSLNVSGFRPNFFVPSAVGRLLVFKCPMASTYFAAVAFR